MSAPVRVPPAVGVKPTPIAQEAPAATVAPQVLPATRKSPVTVTPETVSATPPLLVRVTLWVAADVPKAVEGKLRPPGGDSETPAGAMP